MKAILMSIKPQWVAKILNGEKTIEIRKKFPKDYVGWVYIYCTKNGEKPYDSLVWDNDGKGLVNSKYFPYAKDCPEHNRIINGEVVARFWCDKVEKIRSYLEPEQWYMTSDLGGSGLLRKSCLSFKELDDYLLSGNGYAIHITKLEIFDKPKEISEFHKPSWAKVRNKTLREEQAKQYLLTRAPQSFCFIEID